MKIGNSITIETLPLCLLKVRESFEPLGIPAQRDFDCVWLVKRCTTSDIRIRFCTCGEFSERVGDLSSDKRKKENREE